MNAEKFIDVWQHSMLMGNIQDNHICRLGDLLVTL